MKMRAFTYHRPTSLAEALALLAEHGGDAKIIAGGQSLVPMMAMRLSTPEHLIDISAIDGLGEVTAAVVADLGDTADASLAAVSANHDEHGHPIDLHGTVSVGAMVRHSAAETNATIAGRVPLVAAAMPHIGHRAIRNRGTVCGSLAHADPAAELPAVALALNATFVVGSTSGTRLVPASDFFQGYLTADIRDGEMLTHVRFPMASPGTVVSVVEVSRRHGDFALAGVVAQMVINESGTIDAAAMAIFGVDAVPYRSAEAEAALIGYASTSDVFATAAEIMTRDLNPAADNHGSTAYRKHLAGVLVRRALAGAAGKISLTLGAVA